MARGPILLACLAAALFGSLPAPAQSNSDPDAQWGVHAGVATGRDVDGAEVTGGLHWRPRLTGALGLEISAGYEREAWTASGRRVEADHVPVEGSLLFFFFYSPPGPAVPPRGPRLPLGQSPRRRLLGRDSLHRPEPLRPARRRGRRRARGREALVLARRPMDVPRRRRGQGPRPEIRHAPRRGGRERRVLDRAGGQARHEPAERLRIDVPAGQDDADPPAGRGRDPARRGAPRTRPRRRARRRSSCARRARTWRRAARDRSPSGSPSRAPRRSRTCGRRRASSAGNPRSWREPGSRRDGRPRASAGSRRRPRARRPTRRSRAGAPSRRPRRPKGDRPRRTARRRRRGPGRPRGARARPSPAPR